MTTQVSCSEMAPGHQYVPFLTSQGKLLMVFGQAPRDLGPGRRYPLLGWGIVYRKRMVLPHPQ